MKLLAVFVLLANLILNSRPPVPPPPCPITSLSGLYENSYVLEGTVVPAYANQMIFVYEGYTTEGVPLGTGVVNKDLTFRVVLYRTLRTGDTITIHFTKPSAAQCTYTLKPPPPVIPEPTTVVLLGGGLAALGLKALRSRRR